MVLHRRHDRNDIHSLLAKDHNIIGIGGGRDVLTALSAGTQSVDAVEFNRGIVELMSGPVKDFDTGILGAKGSLYLTRPTVMTYVASDEALQANVADVFDVVSSGAVKMEINQTYQLSDAVQAHKDLEGRKTTGSTVLLP